VIDGDGHEGALLRNLVHGDESAFWELWRIHERHIIDVCRRRMSSAQADVDDAVSRSMFIAHEKMPHYAAMILNVEAWLTRLCCNVCVDVLRERRQVYRSAVPLEEAGEVHSMTAPADSPEAHCMVAEMNRLVARAIDGLRPALRDAARLRFLDEASYPEIAARLSITPANARKRVQQSRSILRDQLVSPDRSRQSDRPRARR